MIQLKKPTIFCMVGLVLSTYYTSSSSDTEVKKLCGQYGFRCVDETSFEICNEPDLDGNLDPNEVHFCAKETMCDEDNPVYCSPNDENYLKVESCRDRIIRELLNRKRFDEHDGINNEDNEPDLTTIIATTEEDEFIKCENEKYTEAPTFQCEIQGFFADNEDKSLFYYCDLKNDGVGFILRHMKCGKNRIFDTIRRECTLIGSTRNIRDESQESRVKEEEKVVLSIRESTNSSYNNCSQKVPGKYADPSNCHNYILCLSPDIYYPFEEITVQCPKRTAYDPPSRSCTKLALSRCFVKRKTKTRNAINCRDSMRFSELKSTDSYYLCYNDQVLKMDCPIAYAFNDQNLRCVPEKWLI